MYTTWQSGRLFASILASLALLAGLISSVGAVPPDLDESDQVDARDLIQLSRAMGSQSGDANWDPEADLDYSGQIDAVDRDILVRYFGLIGRVRRIWVADESTDAISRLSADGTLIGAFSGYATPQKVDVDPRNGRVWVADYGNGRVVRLAPDGTVEAVVSGFRFPGSLAVVDPTGVCWIANSGDNEVVRLAPDVPDGYDIDVDTGSHVIFDTNVSGPSGVAVNDTDGTCWFTNSSLGQVVKLSADGLSELSRRSGFSSPSEVACNVSDGSCWVADRNNNEVVKLSLGGQELLRIDGFQQPASLDVNPIDGSVIVADTGHDQVVRLDPAGGEMWRIDGLNDPRGVFVDTESGNAWVMDYRNNEVVKLAPNGEELLRIGGFTFPRSLALDYGDNLGRQAPIPSAGANTLSGAEPLAVSLSASVNDPDGSILRYQWDFEGDGVFDYDSDSTAATNYTYSTAGIYNPILRVIDDDGLMAVDSSLIVRVGTLRAIADSNVTGGDPPLRVTFTGDFFDPVDGRVANYQWDFDGDGLFDYFSETQPDVSYTYTDPGIYNAIFKVTDSDGSTAQATIVINVPQAVPEANIFASPNSGPAPLQVQLVANASDNDGFIFMYQWDLDNDGSYEWVNTQTGNLVYTFPTRGDYTVNFRAIDNDGLIATDTLQVSVINDDPVAQAGASPRRGLPPLAVSLTGVGTDSDGTIVEYRWDFGDGSPQYVSDTSGNTNHTYDSPGTYNAAFNVTDNEGGFDQDVVTIEVLEPGNPVATAGASPEQGTAPLAVNFTGSGADNGSITLYEWWFEEPFASMYETRRFDFENTDDASRRIAYDPVSDSLILATSAGTWVGPGFHTYDASSGERTGMLDEGGLSFGGDQPRFAVAATAGGRIFHQDENGDIAYWSGIGATPVLAYDDPENDEQGQAIDAIDIGPDTYVFTAGAKDEVVEVYMLSGSTLSKVNQFDAGADGRHAGGALAVSSDGLTVYAGSRNQSLNRYVAPGGTPDSAAYAYDSTFAPVGTLPESVDIVENAAVPEGVVLVGAEVEGSGDSIVLFKADGSLARSAFDVPGGSFSGAFGDVVVDEANERLFFVFEDNAVGQIGYTAGAYSSSASNGNGSHTYDVFGDYAARFRVTDNEGLTDEITVPVQVLGRPVVDIITPLDGATIPKSGIAFGGTAVDYDGSIELYEWDVDGDGTFEYSSTTDGITEGMLPGPGSYIATLRVTDDDGLTGTDSIGFMVAAEGPTATAEATPESGEVPLHVGFEGEIEDPDGAIVRVEWDVDGDATYDLVNEGPAGTLVTAATQYNSTDRAASNVIDGRVGSGYSWRSVANGPRPDEFVFELKNQQVRTIDRVVISLDTGDTSSYNVKDFEVLVSTTGPTTGFTSWTTGTTQNITMDQVTTGTPVAARWVKLRCINSHNSTTYLAMAEFEVYSGVDNVLSPVTARASYTYDTIGEYTAGLRVTDDDGLQATDSVAIAVRSVGSPTVSFDSIVPDPGFAGLPVELLAEFSDSDGEIVALEWDFDGDGSFDWLIDADVVSWTSQYNTTSWAAENLIDGRTGSGYSWSSSFGPSYPVEIVFDLSTSGRSFTIGGVRLNQQTGDSASYMTRNFEVLVSTTAPDSGFSSVGTFEATQSTADQTFSFTAASARWVKLSIIDNYGGNYVEMAEFEVLDNATGRSVNTFGGIQHTYASTGSLTPAVRVTDNDGLMASDSRSLTLEPRSLGLGSVWVTVVRVDQARRYSLLASELTRVLNVDGALAIDINPATGEAWVADTNDDEILKIAADGTVRVSTGTLDGPSGIAVVEADGSVWVADSFNDQVVHFDADGNELARISGFDNPNGIDIDQTDGSVWVADTTRDQVVRLQSGVADGYDIGVDSGSHVALGGFNDPQDVAVDQSERTAIVADRSRNQIVKVSSDGTTEAWRVSGFSAPYGVAVNPLDGTIWVADTNNSAVVKLDRDGRELLRVTGISSPRDLQVNPYDGTCWVGDRFNDRLVQIGSSGQIMRQANTDLDEPYDVDVDSGLASFVNPPTATAGASPLSGPLPLMVNFTGSGSDNGSIVNYEWDFEGDGVFDYASGANGDTSFTYTEPGRFGPVLRVTDNEGYVGYDYSLTVLAGEVTAVLTASVTDGVAPLNVQLDWSAIVPQGRAILYEVDRDGDGDIDRSQSSPGLISHTFSNAGTYTPSLRVTDNLGRTAYAAVTITVEGAPPVARGSATPNSGNSPLEVEFSAGSSSDPDGSIVLYQWDFDSDGIYDWASESNGNVGFIFPTPGQYRPRLRVTDNDGLTGEDRSIVVNAGNSPPRALADADNPEGNAPHTVNFVGDGTDADGTITLYEWDFETDGTYDYSSPSSGVTTNAYPTTGTYEATLRVTDDQGETDTDSITIQVNENGAPTASASGEPLLGTPPLPVTFTGAGSDADGTVVQYLWDFGEALRLNEDGYPTRQLFVGRWPATGATDVSSSRTGAVEADPSPGALFEDRTWQTYDDADGQFNWGSIFGGTSNVFGYSLIYVYAPTAQTVRFSYGVDDSARFWVNETLVEVNSRAGSLTRDEFSFDTAFQQGWNKVLVAVTQGSSQWQLAYRLLDTAGDPLRFYYGVDNPATDPPIAVSSSPGDVEHTYREVGQYTATLIVTDNEGKQDEDTVDVEVTSSLPPTATPRAYPVSGEAPLTVRFTGSGTDPDGTILTYDWDFDGDGVMDIPTGWNRNRPESYTWTFYAPGVYTPSLTVTDDDGVADTASFQIVVSDLSRPPEATVRATPDDGTAPLTVQFHGWGSDTDGFIRLFELDVDSDGAYDYSSALEGRFTHTYSSPGFYTATFRVTDDDGLADTASIAIDAKTAGSPTVELEASPDLGAAALEVVLFATGTDDGHVAQFEWDFEGDGTWDQVTVVQDTSGDQQTAQVIHQYLNAGSFTATVRATDNEGNIDLDRVPVDVSFDIAAVPSREAIDPTLGETVSINSVLNSQATVTVRVLNSVGETIRTLVTDQPRGVGFHSDIWRGTDTAEEIQDAGIYFFVIDYTAGGETGSFDPTNDANPTNYTPSVSYPQTFDPLEDRPLFAQYTISRPAEETIYITDAPGGSPQTVIKTMLMREPRRSGTYVDVWDGTDDEGNVVGDSTYAIAVWLWDLPPNTIIVATRPIISDVSTDPDYFQVSNNPYAPDSTLEVRYSISKPATVRLTFETAEGLPLTTIERTHAGAGSYTATWDGTTDAGFVPGPGICKVKVEAEDDFGNLARPVYGLFRIIY